MSRFAVALALLSFLQIGCGAEPPAAANTPAPPANEKASAFQPGSAGTVVGSVTWQGAVPAVAPVVDIRPKADGTGHETRTLPHPYAPRVDRFTHAVEGAVVYLRNVKPESAKPWDLPPASVEIRDAQILITQGARPGRVGFVRRGEPVKFASAEPVPHTLRGRGAAFFALPFPDPDRPLERSFDTLGRIELTSGAGYHWHAADLFVCDHPYYTTSDKDGRFQFAQVPAGEYELVVWHPNWAVTARERNPETGLVQRVTYAPPFTSVRPVLAVAGHKVLANPIIRAPE